VGPSSDSKQTETFSIERRKKEKEGGGCEPTKFRGTRKKTRRAYATRTQKKLENIQSAEPWGKTTRTKVMTGNEKAPRQA